MKILLIVAALFLAKAYGGVINAKCEDGRFGQCTDTFAKALGLPSMPSDSSVFDAQVAKLMKTQQGIKQLCNAYDGYQKCLGNEYSSCISVDYLKSIGESDKDARDFVAQSSAIGQTCTSRVFKANAHCQYALFDKCTDAFAKALGLPSMPTDASVLDAQVKKLIAQGQQGKAQVCNAGDGLEKCLGDEYSSCISVDYLKSIGESQKDAEAFVAQSKQMEQMCTSANAACQTQRFGQCTDVFAKALGLPSMPTDASVLDAQIQKLLGQGQQGKAQVCNADNGLMTCLGDEYNSCISVDYLKSIGESQKDAEQFVAEAKQLMQMCM